MLVTGHWSGTGPTRLRDYHLEYLLTGTAPDVTLDTPPSPAQWAQLVNAFVVFKNDQLGIPTDYGTWHLNHDPRDQSANIEIGAMCMANATTQNWGKYPFTAAHAWMMAGIVARVCALKGIDTLGRFADSVEPSVLQNGPIFNVSTHAERALQTQNPGVDHPDLGYFIYSGDPDCRWDLSVLQPSDTDKLVASFPAMTAAIASARWIRERAHAIKAAGITDYWGIDR